MRAIPGGRHLKTSSRVSWKRYEVFEILQVQEQETGTLVNGETFF